MVYLHDQDVLAFAKVAKYVKINIRSRCKSGKGKVHVTGAGFSGLWQHFDLWEMASYLNDMPRLGLYYLPFKFLSRYTLHDAREARLFASAAHEVLQLAMFFQNRAVAKTHFARAHGVNSSSDGSAPQSHVRLYFATFAFDVQRVRVYLSQRRSALDPLSRPPIMALQELGMVIKLKLY